LDQQHVTSTTLHLVDDTAVPTADTYPEPCLLAPGDVITPGDINIFDVLYATAKHKRIEFHTIEDGHPRAIRASIRHVKKGVPDTLVCIVELVRSSAVQLQSPIDTAAVLEIDVETRHAVLTCERAGLARVTNVIASNDVWATSLIFDGVTTHWSSHTPQYKVNQLVPVRLPAHGRLVAM
jgi:hypothetical protein